MQLALKISNYVRLISGKERLVFFLLLSLMLGDRFLSLTHFNFDYVGSDDLIYWLAARDYSQGIFHEPYFYGQDYNFMLEALFAVPLVKLDIPLYYAMPISSALISLFPFLLFSAVLFKRGYSLAAYVFLIIPLSLPIEYGITCSMSRGFISGLFFTGFFVFPILSPQKKWSWLIAALATALGYICNPNSLIVSFPVCLYLLFNNFNKLSFYLINIVAVAPVLTFEFFAKKFYETNPDYNTHPMIKLTYHLSYVFENLGDLDTFYSLFTPVVWSAGWLIVPLILITGLLLWKTDKKKAASLIFAVAFIILTLGINKVNDGIKSILLSQSRMYLGIPVVTGLAFFWGSQRLTLNFRNMVNSLLLLSVVVFCVKTAVLKPVVATHTVTKNYGCVAIKKVEDLICNCEKIKKMSDLYKANLIVFAPNWGINPAEMMFYDYGCELLSKDIPQTLLPQLDRRTWVFLSEQEKVRKNVLFYGLTLDRQELRKFDNDSILSFDPEMLIIRNNTKRSDSLLYSLGLDYSRYKE